jgi:hypothetical protein
MTDAKKKAPPKRIITKRMLRAEVKRVFGQGFADSVGANTENDGAAWVRLRDRRFVECEGKDEQDARRKLWELLVGLQKRPAYEVVRAKYPEMKLP